MERFWDGEKDQNTLCKDVDPEGRAVIRLALNWIENPDEPERIMGWNNSVPMPKFSILFDSPDKLAP
jgi:hypothetical protein